VLACASLISRRGEDLRQNADLPPRAGDKSLCPAETGQRLLIYMKRMIVQTISEVPDFEVFVGATAPANTSKSELSPYNLNYHKAQKEGGEF
jgi:hypothetical protein